jgi:hypothetical protein
VAVQGLSVLDFTLLCKWKEPLVRPLDECLALVLLTRDADDARQTYSRNRISSI